MEHAPTRETTPHDRPVPLVITLSHSKRWLRRARTAKMPDRILSLKTGVRFPVGLFSAPVSHAAYRSRTAFTASGRPGASGRRRRLSRAQFLTLVGLEEQNLPPILKQALSTTRAFLDLAGGA